MSLNTRIKRKREVREEIINQDGFIFRVPDETLLHIFKYFKTDELVLAAGFVSFCVKQTSLLFSL